MSFHAVDIKKGDMTANENRSNLGTVVFHRDHAEFDIERQTPTINLRPGLRSNLAMLGLLRRMYARLEPEAARRGQPVPKINLPDA